MKKVITEDKSVTFFNEEFQETYHSTSGAIEEAVKKFVEPTNITTLAKLGKVKILDICFGFGYNSAAAIDAVKQANPNCEIEIIGLELDTKLFDIIPSLKPDFKSYDLIIELANNENPELLKDNLTISIVFGDAVETIKTLTSNPKLVKTFDIVFLDPFSPKKCPSLWTKEFLEDVKKLMKPCSFLTTYSCASQVRNNLLELNFEIKDGPCVGRKAPSTIAISH